MTCEQAELRMAELLAGEIAAEERSALEKHLLDCASCRGDFELARAGARIDWADVPVPKQVIESTLASFREPPPAVRFLRWATAAAAAFGVAALLLTSSRAQKIEDPPAISMPVVERPQVLATMQDAAVGALVAKDEEGRPVGELSLKSHEVTVEILDGIAKTTVEENFENHTGRRLEGTFHFPLPSDASISRLALEVNGKIEEGTCLERERAREVFESIVRKAMDPALLEWQPGGFFKCRVFPIEPRSTKRVIIAYTQALPCFQGKMTYVYPLASEKTRTHPPGEASIAVQARFSGGLTKIESPSHHLDVQRRNPNEASMAFRATNYRPNNDFVVTLEPGDEEVRVVSHKTDGDDGYFACFAVPRGGGDRAPANYAFVIDASASTSAPRLEVAKRLVRAMMERRIEGDRFEILAHHIEVERSGPVDLRAANDFMDKLRPIGGSDVLRALLAAGDAEIIYIGKGAATFGETEPSKILDAVKGRRIRTIAVGSDANGTLLERLGGMMRVSPNDDVAKRVSEIAATLGAPVLSDVKVEGGDAVYDVVGVRDLFYGERLIVSGRYRGPAAKLVLSGRGYRREVDVAFPAKEEGNNYVRRLWAQRRVSDLLAQGPATKAAVTDLGVKHQIMTPYTSFLVLETEQMWKDFQLKREVQKQDEVLSREDQTRGLMEEALVLYRQGKAAEASAKFEAAFELKPTSDQVYAFIRRAGEDVVAQMMNAPERKTQDTGRRLMELAKPSEGLREGKAVTQKYVEELKSEDHAVWRNSFWHLRNMGKHGVKEILPALGDKSNDRFRSRSMLLLSELGGEAAPAVAEALRSNDPFVRSNAAIVLGNIKDPKYLDALIQTVANPNETADVKKFAREAAQKITRGEPTPATTVVEPPPPPAPPVRPVETVKPPRPAPVPPRDPEVTRKEMKALDNEVVDGIRTLPWKAVEWEHRRTPNQSGGLDFTIDEFGQAFQEGRRVNDAMKKWREEYVAVGALQKFKLAGQTAQPDDSWSNLGWAGDVDGKHFPQAFWMSNGEVPAGSRNAPGRDFFSPELKVLQTMELENQRAFMAIPGDRSGTLDTENSGKAGRINDLQRKLDSANTLATKVEADMQVFARQSEVKLAEIQELTMKVDEYRTKLAKSLNEKSLATSELQYARQMAERLQQDLGQLEEKYVEMARDKKHLEEKMNAIAQAGGNVNVAPKRALEAKVTAVANEIGLVVFSVGKDDGVLEGDEFTVYRGGDIVAKVLVDRADRRWAAGKVVMKKLEPRVADDVSNHIFVAPPRTPASGKLRIEAATEDGSWIAVPAKQAGQILAVTRDGKFVALLQVTRPGEARVFRGLSTGRLLPGDEAADVVDPGAYLASLPADVRNDLASRANQQTIRAKMGLKE